MQYYGHDNLALGTDFQLQHVCTAGICHRGAGAAREPPLLPEEMRRRLATKRFTSSADADMVFELYRTFFDGIAATATRLVFSGLEWRPTEAKQLALVLPRMTALTELECAPGL